jgi:integrase
VVESPAFVEGTFNFSGDDVEVVRAPQWTHNVLASLAEAVQQDLEADSGADPFANIAEQSSWFAERLRALTSGWTRDQKIALLGLLATILLGAFVGLRTAEVCGLRVTDVDFMRGVVSPAVQYPDAELKTETSKTPVPIPQSLSALLSAHVQAHVISEHMFRNEWADQLAPRVLERVFRAARAGVVDSHGLDASFRFHDCRHYFASLLIASGADVKVVQARLRHKSAKTTLDTYGHLWPDSDDSTRAAVDGVITAKIERAADYLRTGGDPS